MVHHITFCSMDKSVGDYYTAIFWLKEGNLYNFWTTNQPGDNQNWDILEEL